MPRKPRAACKQCGTLTARANGVYCSSRCQRAFEHDDYIGNWLAGKESGSRADGTVTNPIKTWLRQQNNDQCSQCGWNVVHSITNRVPLEVDHIDGDHNNNRPENLRLLCPNCHSLTPTYRALNKGRGREYRKAA